MKILLNINQGKITALEYYRQLLPHFAMKRNYPDVQVSYQKPVVEGQHYSESIDWIKDDELKEFNIVVFLREVRTKSQTDQIKRCQDLGVKVVFDIDDYWHLPEDHPMKPQYKMNLVDKNVPKWCSSADLVTTTTPYFCSTITEQTNAKWVEVLPNCVDGEEPQFKDTTPTVSRRVRFGWIGGVYHKPDIELMKYCFSSLAKDRKFTDNIQLCLGGYNGFTPEYQYIEKLMTANYSMFRWDRTYIDYLSQRTEMMDHLSHHKPYRRLWGREIQKYAPLYNEIDVALVPLRDTHFSKCKSELKIIEAGWFSKPVICSNITPYKEWIKDGINGFIVGNNHHWLEKMRLMLDKTRREDMGKALNETIKTNFDINKWSEVRYSLYKHLINK